MLVSAIQQCEPAIIYIYSFPLEPLFYSLLSHPTLLGHHRAPGYTSHYLFYTWIHACMVTSLIRLFVTLWTVCSLPGFSVHGIFQSKTLKWVAIPSSRGSFGSRDWTCVSFVSCITGRFFTAEILGKSFHTLYCICFNAAAAAKSLRSCPILCDPIDGSPPGSPIPGILQARTWEWVFQCCSLNLFHPLLYPLCPQIHSLCLHLYSCPANRFISTISYFLYQFIIKL